MPKAISRLRAALGDTPSNSQFIKTIPRRGYRFIPDISTEQPKRRSRHKYIFSAVAMLLVSLLGFFVVSTSNSKNNQNAAIEQTLERADGLYMQFNEQSNEAAIALYQTILETDKWQCCRS